MGTPVPKPAPRQPRPHKGLKRTALSRGDKPLKRTPMKLGDGNASRIPQPIADLVKARDSYRGQWRCQHPGCNQEPEGRHHIKSKAQFGKKKRALRDDPNNLTSLCPRHHDMAQLDGICRLFWHTASDRNLLGEEHRTQRDALAGERGLI